MTGPGLDASTLMVTLSVGLVCEHAASSNPDATTDMNRSICPSRFPVALWPLSVRRASDVEFRENGDAKMIAVPSKLRESGK